MTHGKGALMASHRMRRAHSVLYMVKQENKKKIYKNISILQKNAVERNELFEKVRKGEAEIILQFLDGSEPVRITKVD